MRIRVDKIMPNTGDEFVLANNGLLWVLGEPHSDDDVMRWAKSLTTGYEHLWFEHEYVTADKEQTDGNDT